MPTAISQQLETMCQELNRQRNLLQEIVESQKRQAGGLTGSPTGTGLLPDPAEDSYSVISYGTKSTEPQTVRPSYAAGSNQRQLAIAGISAVHAPPACYRGRSTHRDQYHDCHDHAEGSSNKQSRDPGTVGTKEDHLGIGYLDWSRARYMSLPPAQQDFVDYCFALLENDAIMARQLNRNNQY